MRELPQWRTYRDHTHYGTHQEFQQFKEMVDREVQRHYQQLEQDQKVARMWWVLPDGLPFYGTREQYQRKLKEIYDS